MHDILYKTITHKAFLPTCVGIASFSAGVTVGILYTKNIAKEVIEEVENEVEEDSNQFTLDFDQEQIEEEVSQYRLVINEADYNMPDPEVIDMTEASEDEEEAEELPNVLRKTVEFAGDDTDWNSELEVASRSKDTPYIIHQDEYFAREEFPNFRQTSLVYYEGDDTLCDDHDVKIDNYENVVGKLLFGHGTTDLNSVYVRNEKLKAEYEILKLSGHYNIEVLGMDFEDAAEAAELKHSKNLRFRDE